MSRAIVALLLVSGCGATVKDSNVHRLPHPSAGALPPHTLETTAGYRLSLTKVTNDEICIDAYVTSYSTTADRALEDVKKRLKPDRDGIGFCRGRDQTDRYYCARNEPFPVKQVFQPVIYGVEFSKHASNSYRKTGNREQVCVEELTNHRGTVVGCARYVEQDEQVEGWDGGVLFYARGGWRSCVPNKGLIDPTSSEFDFAFSVVPYRFVFEGGKSASGAWGTTGGTSAETPTAVQDLEAARAAAMAGRPTVTWSPPSTDKPKLGRVPETTTITTAGSPPRSPPTPTPAPAPAPSPTGAPTKPVTPGPAPADPLRGREDKRFVTATLQIVRDGKVIVSIDGSGAVVNSGTHIATWRAGAYVDKAGTTAVAITASGEVVTQRGRLARFAGDKLELEKGGTLSIDTSGRYRLVKGSRVEVSSAMVKVDSRGRKLALVAGLLSVGVLGFAPER